MRSAVVRFLQLWWWPLLVGTSLAMVRVGLAHADDCSGPDDCASTTWIKSALENGLIALGAGVGLGAKPIIDLLFPHGKPPVRPPLTASEKAARMEHIRQINAEAAKLKAESDSWWSFGGDFVKNVGKETIVDPAVGLWNTGKTVVGHGVDIIKDPRGVLTEDWKAVKQSFGNALVTTMKGIDAVVDVTSTAVTDIKNAAKETWNLGPGQIIWDTTKGSLETVWNGVTDPKKVGEFVKEAFGASNWEKSWDPNVPLGTRIANVGIAVVKTWATIETAGQIGSVIKTGGTAILEGVGLKGAATAGETIGGATKVGEVISGATKAGETIGGATKAGETIGGATKAGETIGGATKAGETISGATKAGETVSGAGKAGEAVEPWSGTSSSRGTRAITEAPPGTPVNTAGVPKGDLKTISDIGNKRGVDVSIRPTSDAAKPWLESGKAVPKPPTVHAKSLDQMDSLIGGPANREGLVGYFKPNKQALDDALRHVSDPKMRSELVKRFNERAQEFKELSNSINQNKTIKVVDGVIHDVKTGKPLCSDIDIAGIHWKGTGQPVPEDVKRWIINEIRKNCPNVTHGDLNSWYPTSKEDIALINKLLKGSQPGGKPMITVGAGGTRHTFFK